MTYLKDNNAKPFRLNDFVRMHRVKEKITCLTCYDSSFAFLLDRCGIDILLVGDSMGNVLQGHSTTLPVTMEQMAYHTSCVARGATRALIMADMPFGSYLEGREQAIRNAAFLMAAGAQMVKLEGGAYLADLIHFMVERGIPVCGHIGLTPQSVHQLSGYHVQGADAPQALTLKADALALEQAGAAAVVIEMVPAQLGQDITNAMSTCATIGIGAGPDCSGQVLVLHDMLDVYPGKKARFTRNFMQGAASIEAAILSYVEAVKTGAFPAKEHCY